MNTLKRRRAYCQEDPSAEPVLQNLGPSSSTGLAGPPLPAADYRYRYILDHAPSLTARISVPLSKLLDLNRQEHQYDILEQAALDLDLPIHVLLDISDQLRHPNKKLRLNTNTPMPTSYSDNVSQDGQEKSPAIRAGDAGRKPVAVAPSNGFTSGWAGERLAGCLPFACPPFTSYESPTAYHSLPTSTAYDYDAARPAIDGPVMSMQPHGQEPLDPTSMAVGQAGMFPCEDSSLVAQYLASYPPLQPTRAMSTQPAANREEMVYPVTSQAPKYDNSPQDPRMVAELGIQTQPHLMAPVGPQPISGPFPVETGSPSINRDGPFARQPQRYHPMTGFEVKDDPDGLDLQGRATTAISPQKAREAHAFRITDVKLFKPGQVKGHEWTNRWKDSVVDDIGTWEAVDSRIIQVTEGYTGKSVRLQVRRFQPQDGDRLDRSWMSGGVKKSVSIPPFAIVDMESAKTAFDDYIKKGLIDCCKRLLGPREKLLWQSYALAIKLMGRQSTNETERRLLATTLDLWMSVRLTTKSFEIVGDDTLDMPSDLIKDENNPLHGKIPLPPVMGAQIDSVLIHQIQPHLRRKTLEELQKMTQDKKQKTWLTTYLVTFILLHNIALITKHDAEYAKKHGIKVSPFSLFPQSQKAGPGLPLGPMRFAREDNVKEYNLGANTLLAYFHYCNKGIYPFSAECKDQDLQSLADLDNDAMSFVKYTRRFVSENYRQWQDLWQGEEYENEYYYVSQLFEPNWQPRIMT
ncbi:hypothetical protein OQA88_4089 [Cercophora sp. LCS_1]